MEKNTRVVIGAVLILFIAMLSFRFDTLTGMASTSDWEPTAKITVEPNIIYNDVSDNDIVTDNRMITVTVKSQNWLMNGDGYGACFYRDGTRVACTRELCKMQGAGTISRCKENVFNFRVPTNWNEGHYQIAVREYPKSRTFSKTVYSGDFDIKDKEAALRHANIYNTGKITA